MNYYIAQDRFGNYDLAHHGIKGQKWGVRRYQNDDGSLTSAGRLRYNVGSLSGKNLHKGLGRLNKDLNRSRRKYDRLSRKAAKAEMRGDSDKKKEYESEASEVKKSIQNGEKFLKNYFSSSAVNRSISEYEDYVSRRNDQIEALLRRRALLRVGNGQTTVNVRSRR